jgi:hypothetical protein
MNLRWRYNWAPKTDDDIGTAFVLVAVLVVIVCTFAR